MQDDYNKLKNLLLQDEMDQLNTVTRILKNLEKKHRQEVLVDDFSKLITKILSKSIEDNHVELYATLEPILSKSVHNQLSRNDEEIQKILFPIISASIDHQIQHEHDSLIDALYPRMGGMMKSYLRSSLSHWMHNLNDKIKNIFTLSQTPKKPKERQEENSVPIDAVFLIHKDSTLLISDLYREKNPKISKVEILTKVRSYLHTLNEDENQESAVNEIEYGDWFITVESGKYCYLAVLTSNHPSTRNNLVRLLIKNRVTYVFKHLHDSSANNINTFNGDTRVLDMKGIKKTLSTLLEQQETPTKSFPWYSTLLLSILFLLPLGWYGNHAYLLYQDQQQEQTVRNIIQKDFKVYDLKVKCLEDKQILITGLLLNPQDIERIDRALEDLKTINRIEAMHGVTANKLLHDISLGY